MRKLCVSICVLLILSVLAAAQSRPSGIEKLRNIDFSEAGTSSNSAAAFWQPFPSDSPVATNERIYTDGGWVLQVSGPFAGAWQRAVLNQSEVKPIRCTVEVKPYGPVVGDPGFEPQLYHMGAVIYAEIHMQNGTVAFYNSAPLAMPFHQDDWITVGFSTGPLNLESPVSYIDVVVGVLRMQGTAQFRNPSLTEHERQGGIVTFMVDDNDASIMDVWYPKLKQAGYVGSLALVSSWLDQPGYITSEQARYLFHQENWDIVSHSETHRNLLEVYAQEGPDGVRREAVGSSRTLEEKLYLPGVYAIATPFGSSNGLIDSLLEEEYDSIRNFWTGMNHRGVWRKDIRVQPLDERLTPEMLHKIIMWTAQDKGWTIFVGHKTLRSGRSEYDVHPDQIDDAIRTIQKTPGLRVMNFEQALSEMSDGWTPPTQHQYRVMRRARNSRLVR